jgi:class 3 adenylate cyclase
MISTDSTAFPDVATEAIVVVDLVESTATSNLFGWYAVGRQLLPELRALILAVSPPRGLRCLKSTGDGYLLTFGDRGAAENAAVHAVDASFELLGHIETRNRQVSEERALHLRIAVHLGEVDVVENDREGPHVSFTFRLGAISRASLTSALNPIAPEGLPLRNYILCSEEVVGILSRRAAQWTALSIGLFKLKGFPGWREVFQLRPCPVAALPDTPVGHHSSGKGRRGRNV